MAGIVTYLSRNYKIVATSQENLCAFHIENPLKALAHFRTGVDRLFVATWRP
jgi:hypothetical protein